MANHPGLTEEEVLTRGGWHLRYARVLAVASDGGYGFAVVDGNGDGAELETEIWEWDGGTWINDSSCGAGPLDLLEPVQTGGQVGSAYFAYGSAPGRQSITVSFDGRHYDVPVGRQGVWAFIKARADRRHTGFPYPAA
jgi:hypothetical protein